MRLTLGDGYVQALAKAWPEVPENADLVMYWWAAAAEQVRAGGATTFGLITTNSINQSFNRATIRTQLAATPPLAITLAIPDHPWVDAAEGAAVRVAMTVGRRGPALGRVLTLASEAATTDGAHALSFREVVGTISEDLRAGASPAATRPLHSNQGMAYWGVKFYGDGFIVASANSPLVRPFVSGKDLARRLVGGFVIDCDGLDEAMLRDRHPHDYQWLLDNVRPVRAHNPRAFKRERWWIFGENQPGMRRAVAGLPRYVATTETAKHRVFVFVPGATLAEGTVCAIGTDDALHLGVLSSHVHVTWSLAAGGRLGVGNDPRYNKTRCFDPFPFPTATDAICTRIRDVAERLDAHRKRQLVAHPKLTITSMYNVLEKLRPGEALTDKDKVVHEEGLVSILKQLHDELDAAVFDAYGWSHDLTDEQILEKLVALNAERAAEEARGLIRYLRPDFQAPKTVVVPTQPALPPEDEEETTPTSSPPPALPEPDRVWPKDYFAQASAVRDLVASLPDGTKFNAASLDPHFKGKGAKREELIAKILSTFAKLGHFVTLAPGYYGRPVRRAG